MTDQVDESGIALCQSSGLLGVGDSECDLSTARTCVQQVDPMGETSSVAASVQDIVIQLFDKGCIAGIGQALGKFGRLHKTIRNLGTGSACGIWESQDFRPSMSGHDPEWYTDDQCLPAPSRERTVRDL